MHHSKRVQTTTDLIHEEVVIDDKFGVFRSIRIGSETYATEKGVSDRTINLIHRWSEFEKKGNNRPSMKMMDHYLDVQLVLEKYLAYSRAL